MTWHIATAIRGNRIKQTGTYDGTNAVLTTGTATGYQGIQDVFSTVDEFPLLIASTGGDAAQWGIVTHNGATGGTVTTSWKWSETAGSALTTGQAIVARVGPLAEGHPFVGVIAEATSFSVPAGGSNVTGWSDLHDPFGTWSATGQAFTVPSWVGAFQVAAHVQWDSATGGTHRTARISRCGQNPAESAVGAAGANQSLSSPVVYPSDNAVSLFLDQDTATGVPAFVEMSLQFWLGEVGVIE